MTVRKKVLSSLYLIVCLVQYLILSFKVKHINASIYKRMRDIISNPDRKFYVFSNEHHKETYVEREKDEFSNDRNDRAIRVSAR